MHNHTTASSAEPRSAVIIPDLHHTPHDPKQRKNWVCWKYALRDGRLTKVPINPYTGGMALPNGPTTWGTLEIAMKRLQMHADRDELCGVGYVISEDDPYIGIDYDDCINPVTGELDPTVAAELEELNGYAEISPSGRGVKVIVGGKKPGHAAPIGSSASRSTIRLTSSPSPAT